MARAPVDGLVRFLSGEAALPPGVDELEATATRRFAESGGELPRVLSDRVAGALVETLVGRRDAERLRGLAADGSRDLAKAARRGLHRLRTLGVDAEVARPEPAAPQVAPRDLGAEREGWLGVPDGAGELLVALVAPAVGGGADQLTVVIADDRGLLACEATTGPRKLWRTVRRELAEKRRVIAAVPFDYALWRIEEAYALTLQIGRSAPPGFAGARGLFGVPAGSYPRHPAWEEVAPDLTLGPAAIAGVHELADLRTWIAPREALTRLEADLAEIEVSVLVVDERQRMEARRAAVDRAILASLGGPSHGLWQSRLLDAAYVFARAGRTRDAVLARTAAERLRDPDYSPLEDPFARALVEKVLPAALTTALVIDPGAPQLGGEASGRIVLAP